MISAWGWRTSCTENRETLDFSTFRRFKEKRNRRQWGDGNQERKQQQWNGQTPRMFIGGMLKTYVLRLSSGSHQNISCEKHSVNTVQRPSMTIKRVAYAFGCTWRDSSCTRCRHGKSRFIIPCIPVAVGSAGSLVCPFLTFGFDERKSTRKADRRDQIAAVRNHCTVTLAWSLVCQRYLSYMPLQIPLFWYRNFKDNPCHSKET